MFEYKFVPYKVETVGKATKRPEDGYQKVVQVHAAQGWRLVQVFPPGLPAAPDRFDLIFERKAKAAKQKSKKG